MNNLGQQFIQIRQLIRLFTICLLFLTTQALAQNGQEDAIKNKSIEKKIDWSFIVQMGTVQYIDFSKAPFAIKQIQLISTNNQILYKDKVADLSSNTLYEISLPQNHVGYYILYIIGEKQAISKMFRVNKTGI